MFRGFGKRAGGGRHHTGGGQHRLSTLSGRHRFKAGKHRVMGTPWDTNFFSYNYKPRHGRGLFSFLR